jgi:hypothetical protein
MYSSASRLASAVASLASGSSTLTFTNWLSRTGVMLSLPMSFSTAESASSSSVQFFICRPMPSAEVTRLVSESPPLRGS